MVHEETMKLFELLGLPKQQAKASRGEDPSLPLETGVRS